MMLPRIRRLWRFRTLPAYVLTILISVTASYSEEIDPVLAHYPLFGADKDVAIHEFTTAVGDPNDPKQFQPDCEEFFNDFFAGNVQIVHPVATATTLRDVLNSGGLDKCPETMIGEPPPSPIPNDKPVVDTGPTYDRFDLYAERSGGRVVNVLTYRRMSQTGSPSQPTLHLTSLYTVRIDPDKCVSRYLNSETPSRAHIRDEDGGNFLISWKRHPVFVSLARQTRQDGPRDKRILWSLMAQSQLAAFPLTCTGLWRRQN